MKDRWFAVATHSLALLSQSDEGQSSASIAGSVGTNPAFLRRVLALLAKGGLLDVREGRDGGYRLSRPAESITLAEVYRITSRGDTLLEPHQETNVRCPIGAGMPATFAEIAEAVEITTLDALSKRTIAEVAQRALAMSAAQEC
jgi:Rrf2 family protein